MPARAASARVEGGDGIGVLRGGCHSERKRFRSAGFRRIGALTRELEQPAAGGWKPWFPVIDYDRCTNCMQCLSFCLFDVYGVSTDGKIQVQNQDNCKTDCPACSRVCPEVAIMFPKYATARSTATRSATTTCGARR